MKKKVLKRVVLIITILLLKLPFVVGLNLCIFRALCDFLPPYDISDTKVSIGYSYTIAGAADLSSLPEPEDVDVVWYENIDEAILDTSAIKERSHYENIGVINEYPLKKFYYADGYSILYLTRLPSKTNDFVYMIIQLSGECMDGKCSQPLYIWSTLVEQSVDDMMYTYDFDDVIAQSIVYNLAFGRPIFDENDNQVFYGVVKDKEELESLTIDGNPVDEIIPIETQDGMYYFWTYSKTRIAEKLDIDMGEFRYQEVIDQLEIKYDKQEEE